MNAWIHAFNATAQLPVFFCVSGILAVGALGRPFREVFRRRVLPLLWVFVIWQPVVFAYKFAAGQFLPNQEDTSLGAHLLRFALFAIRPSGELWFLWALAVFILVAYAARRITPWIALTVAGVISFGWMTFASAILGSGAMRALGPGLSGLPTYFFFFLLGVVGSQLIRRVVAEGSAALVGVALVLWIGSVVGVEVTRLSVPGLSFVMKVIGLFGCLALAVLLARVSALGHVGRASMNIYLVHTATIVSVLILTHSTGLPTAGSASPRSCRIECR